MPIYYIPVLGRLSPADYLRLLLTWLLLLLETCVRFLLFVIPSPVVDLLDWVRTRFLLGSRYIFRHYSAQNISDQQQQERQQSLVCHHIDQICHAAGYELEEYLVMTADGYGLGLHRIRRLDAPGDHSSRGPPALLWHGFMMNSEVWVCHPEKNKNLAFVLADQGYDVWLANVRGNKYSCYHQRFKPSQTDFWDFCMDQLALIDLPTIINFVLRQTNRKSLSYIGFSQGTTIAFAALSLLPELHSKINLFIAMAPSMKPKGLSNKYISSWINSSMDLIYLIFGRRSLLSSVLFYQDWLDPKFYAKSIDASVRLLFDWRSNNMTLDTKSVTYQHLYSICSVKLMVHWFQIIREKRFQMYNELGTAGWNTMRPRVSEVGVGESENNNNEKHPGEGIVLTEISHPSNEDRKRNGSSASLNSVSHWTTLNRRQPDTPMSSRAYFPQRFTTEQIKLKYAVELDGHLKRTQGVPIALLYGGSDTLLDMTFLLSGLSFRPPIGWKHDIQEARESGGRLSKVWHSSSKPPQELSSPVVFLKSVNHYEHLCFLWADDVDEHVIPDIIGLLNRIPKWDDEN